jgi:hypothetical protein
MNVKGIMFHGAYPGVTLLKEHGARAQLDNCGRKEKSVEGNNNPIRQGTVAGLAFVEVFKL